MITLTNLSFASLALGAESAKSIWVVVSLLISIGLSGLIWRMWSAKAALLVMALFMGGIAQLWLTQPLYFVYLRLRPEGLGDLLAGGTLAAEAAIALIILIRSGAFSKIGAILAALGTGRIIALLALTAAVAATPMDLVPLGHTLPFVKRVIIACAVIGVHLLCVAALLSLPTPNRPTAKFPIWALALLATALSTGMAYGAFQALPHVEDEVAHLFQAKTFAAGALTAPAPPEALRPGLEYYLIDIVDERWFATTTPGWPAGLALGVWLGAPWLINPLLAGLAVLLTFALVSRLTDTRTAAVAAALTAVSPWMNSAAGSLMSHTLANALALFCWVALVLPAHTRTRALTLAFVGGAAMGWVFTMRQLDGLMLGVLTGIALLVYVRRNWGLARTVAYSAGCLFTGTFYFFYSWAMTGTLFMSPLTRYLAALWPAGANGYGFGPERGAPGDWGILDGVDGHSPFEGVMSVLQNSHSLNLDLLGWGIGSMILLWAALVWRKPGRLDALLWAAILIDVGAHAFYWFPGSYYIGPRYWFGMAVPVIVLCALGFRALEARLLTSGATQQAVTWTLVVLLTFSALIYVPWRGATKYLGFGRSTTEIRETNVPENALVFFSGDFDPGVALILNDPFLPDDQPIYLRSMDPTQDAAAAAAYPERPVVKIDLDR